MPLISVLRVACLQIRDSFAVQPRAAACFPHHAAAGMPLRARDPAVGHLSILAAPLFSCERIASRFDCLQDRARVESCFVIELNFYNLDKRG